MIIRAPGPEDIDPLAAIWHQTWHEAHAHLVPPHLTRARTFESFRERIAKALPHLRVAGAPGAPLGFCLVKEDELYQLLVAARFYEKHGWRRVGTMVNDAETSNGAFPLEVWRYEKVLIE